MKRGRHTHARSHTHSSLFPTLLRLLEFVLLLDPHSDEEMLGGHVLAARDAGQERERRGGVVSELWTLVILERVGEGGREREKGDMY